MFGITGKPWFIATQKEHQHKEPWGIDSSDFQQTSTMAELLGESEVSELISIMKEKLGFEIPTLQEGKVKTVGALINCIRESKGLFSLNFKSTEVLRSFAF